MGLLRLAMVPSRTRSLLLAGLVVASQAPAGPGTDLAAGTRLLYSSNGAAQPEWIVDSVYLRLTLLPDASCARVYLRRRPDQPAEESRVCVRGDTLLAWNARRATWLPQRPIGPGMTMTFPQANGDTVRYSTEDIGVEEIAGRRIGVVRTVVLTVDSIGRPKRRLRERYAVGLTTATGGIFEVPDSAAAGGWRTQQAFELRELRRP